MNNLLRYIVISFFYFNILTVQAAQIGLNSVDDDENAAPVDTSFVGAVNLPHPADINRMITSKDSSFLGNIGLIGTYFNYKYPAEAIETDLSEDVAQIFPGSTEDEIESRTKLIRGGVMLFRWGMEKYTRIKEKILMPPEPPLYVEDEDIAKIDTSEYVETEANQFAIKYDFKKVVPYSGNARDIDAVRAQKQRLIDSKKHKTNYEKFKSMIDKIEFTKLHRYGYDIPNPFVGNAGTSPWEEKNGFRSRLVTEMAEYADAPRFLGGVHISVPGYRFILGNSIDEARQKPSFELVDSENIDSVEFFTPAMETVISDYMVGAYSGDAFFPFVVTPKEPDQPVFMVIKSTFNSCDTRLDCELLEFEQELEIETAEFNNYSSFQNFVTQRHIHLPEAKLKNFELTGVTVETNPDNDDIEKIYLTFDYDGSVHKFNLFLEDDIFTNFYTPTIAINQNKLYVTIVPLNHKDKLLGKTLTMTVQFNLTDKLRQNIKLEKTPNSLPQISPFLSKGLWAGLLFILTPLGLLLFLIAEQENAQSGATTRPYLQTVLGFLLGIFAAMLILAVLQHQQAFLYWGMQYRHIGYLVLTVFFLLMMKTFIRRSSAFSYLIKKRKCMIMAFLAVFFTPCVYIPYFKYALYNAYASGAANLTLTLILFAIGICLPFILMDYFCLKLGDAFKKVVMQITNWLFWLQFCILTAVIFIQLSFAQFAALSVILCPAALVFKFLFAFDSALHETTLPLSQKIGTEIVLVVLSGLTWLIVSAFMPAPQKKEVVSTIPYDIIDQKMKTGANLVLKFDADWCLECKIFNFLTFNEYNQQSWSRIYKIDFLSVDATIPGPETIEYFQKYNHVSAPLNVFYSYQIQEGLAFSDWILEKSTTKLFQNLAFSY